MLPNQPARRVLTTCHTARRGPPGRKRWSALVARLAALAAISAGCADDSGTPPPDPDGDGTPVGQQGGEVTSSDGRLVLQVPAGALQSDARVAISVLSPDSVSLGSVYRLDAGGAQFTLPVTVEIELDSATVGDVPAEALGLAFRGSGGDWMADDSSGTLAAVAGSGVAHALARSPTRVVVGRIDFRSEMYVTVRTLWKAVPASASVAAGEPTLLTIQACVDEVNRGQQGAPFRSGCQPVSAPITWRLRSATGTGHNLGTVEAGQAAGSAFYTAPVVRPDPPVVLVEASWAWGRRGARFSIPVVITEDTEGAGVLDWEWSWTANHTEQGPTSTTVSVISRASKGSGTFTQSPFSQYSWLKESSTFTWEEKSTTTTTITTGTCSTVEVESAERVKAGDATTPVPWSVGVNVNRGTGLYALAIGLETFKVKNTDQRTVTKRCLGEPDEVVTTPPFETTSDEALALPSMIDGIALGDPGTRRFNSSARLPVDVRWNGEDHTYIVHLQWDFTAP